MTEQYHLGIDLGTSNSCAMVLTADRRVVPISASSQEYLEGNKRERTKPFPSIVVYDAEGNPRAVGLEAKRIAQTEPEYAIFGVKRLLAKTYKEAQRDAETQRLVMDIQPDEMNGRCVFEFPEKDVRPEDVCAELLRHIRRTAEAQMGVEFPHVVISVPAFFDALAVTATVQAAKMAGFDSVDTVPEPVAAALAYDLELTPRPLNVACFDLGAGTLDCSISQIRRTGPGPQGIVCDCKKNTGDTRLGGLDMDDRLMRLLIRRLELESLNPSQRAELRRSAEAAKIDLSSELDTTVTVSVGTQTRSCTVSRFEFEAELQADPKNLLAACEEQVRLALKEANWSVRDVDAVLLVGGPTAMPCIQRVLERVFRANPNVLDQITRAGNGHNAVDPMLAVATGAAKFRAANVTRIHPYGYGFVNVRAEPEAGKGTYRVTREARITIPPDHRFPTQAVTVTPDDPFRRGDNIFAVQIIQQAPRTETEQNGSGGKPYRFLGELQVAYTRQSFLPQISMRLTDTGELETTIRNLFGPETATYLGVGALQRHPISLPSEFSLGIGGGSLWTFSSQQAQDVRQWGEGFARFLRGKLALERNPDSHLVEELADLEAALESWEEQIEQSTNKIFTQGKVLLMRGQEVRVISEAQRFQWEDQLDGVRSRCYQSVGQD